MKAIATNQTISWFYQRYKEDKLVLSPDFQRNPVWQKPQKNYLIETILLDLPIPEIYILNRISSDGDSIWVVVDGQQRLRTILEFVTEEIEVKLKVESLGSIRSFKDLSDDAKKKLWRYPIVIRDLEDSSDDDVRSLFQRLNKYSFTLNDQELRNARFKGEFLKIITEIGEHEFWITSGVFSSNDIRRMLDLEYISILLCTMIGGVFHRKERLDEFYTNYEDEFEQNKFYIDRTNENLEIIQTIIPDIRKTMWRNKVNFFTLFVVIYNLDENLKIIENVKNIRNKLEKFENLYKEAKDNPDEAEKFLIEYIDAATAATNDKDNRIRRIKILKGFLTN